MWIKLLAEKNIEKLIRPSLVNGRWRGPVISGRERGRLKRCFEKAGVPWIYDPPTPEVHENSPYNKAPKGNRHDNLQPVRMARVRAALMQQDKKISAYRQERVDGRKPRGFDSLFFLSLQFVGEGRKGKKKHQR